MEQPEKIGKYEVRSRLGQGATMVGAFWGVFIWKEFKGAPKGTNGLLAAMFLLYLIGLAILIASKS